MKRKILAFAITQIYDVDEMIHELCVWHVEKNVLEHCKKYFVINEKFEIFMKIFKDIIYSSIEKILQKKWMNFNREIDVNIVIYIEDNHWNNRKKWVKYYTDKVLHFDNIITSRDEKRHHVVKNRLQYSIDEFKSQLFVAILTIIDDLKTIMNKLNLLFIDRRHDYVQTREKTKTRLFHDLRFQLFRNLIFRVTSFALRKTYQQWQRLTQQSIAIESCTNIFITIMRLSCAHRIQNRMYDRANEEMLLLKNIHSHWKFTKSTTTTTITTSTTSSSNEVHTSMRIDDEMMFLSNNNILILNTLSRLFSTSISHLLFTFTSRERFEQESDYVRYNEFEIVKLKDRSSKSLNKNRKDLESQRRQQIFENSTRRELSSFERVKTLLTEAEAKSRKESTQTVSNNQSAATTKESTTTRATARRLLVKSSRRRSRVSAKIASKISKNILSMFIM